MLFGKMKLFCGSASHGLAHEVAELVSRKDGYENFRLGVADIGGSITLTIDGESTTYNAGDMCEVPRGTVHAEKVGPDGVQLCVAKRT